MTQNRSATRESCALIIKIQINHAIGSRARVIVNERIFSRISLLSTHDYYDDHDHSQLSKHIGIRDLQWNFVRFG